MSSIYFRRSIFIGFVTGRKIGGNMTQYSNFLIYKYLNIIRQSIFLRVCFRQLVIAHIQISNPWLSRCCSHRLDQRYPVLVVAGTRLLLSPHLIVDYPHRSKWFHLSLGLYFVDLRFRHCFVYYSQF